MPISYKQNCVSLGYFSLGYFGKISLFYEEYYMVSQMFCIV